MNNMRPGQRIKFWSPRFLNQPDVAAPGTLRILAGIAMLSVAGVPFYAVVVALGGRDMYSAEAIYITTVHFVLPFALFYSVNANSPLSRPIVAIYTLVLGGMTIAGEGFLGKLPVDEGLRTTVTIVIVVAVLVWLAHSPKMRAYYALLRGDDVPIELQERQEELTTTDWMGPRAKALLSSILDHLETVILLAFIVVVFAAVVSM